MKDPNDLPPNTDAPDPIGKLLDTFETRMRNVFGDLKQNILAREWDHEFRPAPDPTWIAGAALADPVKRWPFAESPGDFTNRLYEAYSGNKLPSVPQALLAAVRTVLIEQPPRLAPWLDPGAAAKDSARLNLIEIALRHAFALFRPGGADITPEAILALGKSYDVLDAAARVSTTPNKDLPTVWIKDGDDLRYYDAMRWTEGVLVVELAPRANPRLVEPTLSIPVWLAKDLLKFLEGIAERPQREMLIPIGAINAFREIVDAASAPGPVIRTMTTAGSNPEDTAFARSLGNLTEQLVPKTMRKASRAQIVAAYDAIRNGLVETNIRAGNSLLANVISDNEYERIAHAVADAVVGAEQ